MSKIATILEKGPRLRAKGDGPHTDDALLNRLALAVGLTCIGLPVVLLAGALLGNSCMRDSLSHFYHAQFLGAIFVGLLFFIGGYLIAYTGEHPLEDHGSTLAGLCAFGVALFPVTGSGCADGGPFLSRVFVQVHNTDPISLKQVSGQKFFDLFPNVADFHMVAAGGVFIYLGLFCLIVMKRVLKDRHLDSNGQLIASKRRRNRYYSYCGIVILACVGVIFFKTYLLGDDGMKIWNRLNLTFYFEAAALWAFGVAWFIKARLFERMNDPHHRTSP